jgi:PKD domain
MKREKVLLLACITVLICAQLVVASNQRVSAQACQGQGVEGDLTGSQDTAVIVGRAAASCTSASSLSPHQPVPYYTFEIRCSPNRVAALAGVCSATPCRNSFFALRTLHHPNGTTTPAGFQCVTLTHATPTPGLTTAQVFAAIRRVKLPGGAIRATPQLRGLANLASFFSLHGATQPPVDLQVGGQLVHAEFQPVEYRWAFGDGQQLVTTGPGTPSLHSEVHSVFHRRGRYQVTVTVLWTAQAFLGGRRVGQVEELASQAATSYPVAEIRTTLTG